ncbi:MAG: sodium:solute symporter family protein [Candidatus Omnitrophota bacterium]|jgi:Na+/proline symporter
MISFDLRRTAAPQAFVFLFAEIRTMNVDLLIILGFIVYSVTIGFVMQKKASRGLTEYFLAGRTLKGWQAGFSMAATQYAADTPLLVTGLIATAGIFSLWRLWVYALAFLLMGFMLGPCWRRAGVLTDAEFTELRYAGKGAVVLRGLKAVYMGLFINCTVLAMVLLAATRIAEPFLLWHEWFPGPWMAHLAEFLEIHGLGFTALPAGDPLFWIRSADNIISIALIVGFTALYSMTGGLRSVVATDVVQFLITMIATAFYAGVIVTKLGGLGVLTGKLTALYGASAAHGVLSFNPPPLNETVMIFLAVLSVQWFAQVNADGTGYLAQRTMACRSDRDARVAGAVFTVAQVLFRTLVWLPIGIGLLILYPADSLTAINTAGEHFRLAREATFITGIHELLPAGLRGLMLTGMLAALASTVDTHLNWGASYWANDLYKGLLMERGLGRTPKGPELVLIARLSNLLVLAFALWIASHLRSIQSAWHLSLLFGSGIGVVLILRWIWHRINLWSEVAAIASSLVLAPILLFVFKDWDEGSRMLVMLGASTMTMIFVTLITEQESREKLVCFYQKVRPPGFWGPVSVLCGEAAGVPFVQFRRSVLATALGGLSIFLLIPGIGRMLLAGSWAADPAALWMASVGAILVPAWWRLGVGREKAGSLT